LIIAKDDGSCIQTITTYNGIMGKFGCAIDCSGKINNILTE